MVPGALCGLQVLELILQRGTEEIILLLRFDVRFREPITHFELDFRAVNFDCQHRDNVRGTAIEPRAVSE